MRRGSLRSAMAQPGVNLFCGDMIDILPWLHAAYAPGSGPTRTPLRGLGEPGRAPAGDDGLPVGMAGGMMIVAPSWAGFRITPGPDAGIDHLPVGSRGEWILGDQFLQRGQVHRARVERIIDTAPLPLERGRQTQMGRRLEHGGRQDGVDHLEERIAPTAKNALHLVTEGLERFQFGGFHTGSRGAPPPSCLLGVIDRFLLVK